MTINAHMGEYPSVPGRAECQELGECVVTRAIGNNDEILAGLVKIRNTAIGGLGAYTAALLGAFNAAPNGSVTQAILGREFFAHNLQQDCDWQSAERFLYWAIQAAVRGHQDVLDAARDAIKHVLCVNPSWELDARRTAFNAADHDRLARTILGREYLQYKIEEALARAERCGQDVVEAAHAAIQEALQVNPAWETTARRIACNVCADGNGAKSVLCREYAQSSMGRE